MSGKKKKGAWRSYLGLVLIFLLGVVLGVLSIQFVDLSFLSELSPRLRFLGYVLLIAIVFAAYFLQVIVHEAGHLVFGLLSKFRFQSFRVGSIMLIKKQGRYTFRKYVLAGTGGQCLMIPPCEEEITRARVGWFLMGGSIFNLALGGACLAIVLLLKVNVWILIFLGMSAAFGLLFALLNGIPMRTGMIANDGANALALKRDADAARELCCHLTINAQNMEGVRLRDMPAEWFAFPNAEQLKNNAYAERAVFACNRLMDEMRFAEAAEQMRSLLDADSAMVGVHRNLLICDLLYCELVGECREEILATLYTRELMKFIHTMQSFPSVIRTEYAFGRLYDRTSKKASLMRAAFEKCEKNHPSEGDLAMERELMKHVDHVARERGEEE